MADHRRPRRGGARAGGAPRRARVAGLLLVGRRPPDAATAAQIARWRAEGVAVAAAAVDVTDAAALAQALAEARPGLPPIVAAVHAAGVRGDAPLAALTPDHLAAVLAPKLDGAAALAAATTDDPLRALVLLGSIAALVGNAGQAAYAAANGALDGLAHRLRAAGRPAICLAFGPWAVGMADDATRDRLDRIGAEAFAPAEGAALVSRLATLPRPSLAVARVDWRRWARHAPPDAALAPLLAEEKAAAPDVPGAPDALDRAALRALEAEARGAALRAWLGARLAALLELDAPPADDTRLIDLGFDSFFAVRLRGLLDAAGVGVPIARLLDDATPAGIAALILADLDATTASAPAAAETQETEEFVF
ncbi:MAG: SDR family NAD(P)-dependent oxidoreductase [Myxococcales bacterium]|nr:SDR family NAD(P)-dependent oxidoreductase [Myxococcales bacterium]